MPWQGSARFPYEFESILQHAPMQPGVYAIFAEGQWLYVGEADNLCGRLLHHPSESNARLARYRPTHFAFEVVTPQARTRRHRELRQEFQPVCAEEASTPESP